jgi:predicted enzyme related to lactoylglutathione lyase
MSKRNVVHVEIPDTGWMGVFRDPTGNVLALYTSMHPSG